MITNTEGYIHIIEYLTAHLNLFENSNGALQGSATVMGGH